MALTKNARSIVSSVANTATSTTRGRLDMTAVQGGGYLTIKMTNGGTGPTTQCICNIMIAHNASQPSAGSAGADWKTIAVIGGDTTAGKVTEAGFPIDPAVMQLEVEFTGNTGQSVTVEAGLSELTTIA